MSTVNPPPALTRAIVVFDDAQVARCDRAIMDAKSVTAVDSPAVHETATAIYKTLQAAEKQVETRRKAVKEPVLDLGRLIDDAAKSVAEPIAAERKRLGVMLAAYEAEVDRQRREAEAAERARLAEIARREREAQDAADAARRAMLADDWGALADVPAFVVTGPVDDIEALVTVPVSLAPSAIKMVTRYRVEIVDADKIPRQFLVVDEAAVLAALKAGFPVDGAVLHSERVPAARGS